ncbi:MAG: helix-turn-helix protein [Sphingomonas bacterium]|uniref:hypothetical protein n=1 Tax=Sphingomonas bacterium TaxID=1895847 RepID=UPI00260823B2|nr:hypothetical protein [Sphingomonas bacterium]MDB5710363.1 helix-turn-helix protein [Sphingomonas bacterium]
MTSANDTSDRKFWGHIGLRFPGATHTKKFPITAGTVHKLRLKMYWGQGGSQWTAVETLNNRVLVFQPKQMQRIWLLDSASEGPTDDFALETTMADYAGIPTELYRLMAQWADGGDDFERNQSAAKREAALTLIKRGGFSERPQDLRALLRHTVIHFVDGTTTSYEADRQNLDNIVELGEDSNTEIVDISASKGDECYCPVDMLRMIDIPLIELESGQSETQVGFDEEVVA